MVNNNYLILAALCFLMVSCRHENSQVYPEEFKPYVHEFFIQANVRGYELFEEHFNFSIQFGATDDGLGGYCNTKDNAITINQEDWAHRTHQEKMLSIFHELGHCILHRNHRNQESLSNECFSYMKGNEDGFDCSLNLHSALWLDYYLDELYDSSTPLPAWYVSSQDFGQTHLDYTTSWIIQDTLVQALEYGNLRFNQQDTFLFELTFYDIHPDEGTVAFNIGDLRFAYCNDCTMTTTNLQLGNIRIYATSDIIATTDIRFSVFRNQDIVSFYVNDIFVHAMEYEIIKGNLFKTDHADEPVRMSVRYLY